HADHHPRLFKYPVDQAAMTDFFQEQLAADHSAIFIAWDGDAPVGYIWCIFQDLPENTFFYARKRVAVDQISVNPEYRGKGVGEQLMLMAEAFARERGVIELDLTTWAFNTQAHSFFERMGYAKYRQSMWKMLDG
ncbi:MAG: GNAT family N-acetyltransferase, partial [Chloroflexota bacterium]